VTLINLLLRHRLGNIQAYVYLISIVLGIFRYSDAFSQLEYNAKLTDCFGAKSIPFATIINLTKQTISLTDSSGLFYFSDGDTFEIRCMGYRSKKITKRLDACLLETSFLMGEIIISPREDELINLTKFEVSKSSDGILEGWGQDIEKCIAIKNGYNYSILLKYLKIPFLNYSYPNSENKFTSFKLSIYEINGTDSKSILSLLKDTVIISPTKQGFEIVYVDLEKYGIKIDPNSTILIGLATYEWSGGYWNTTNSKILPIYKWKSNLPMMPWGTRIITVKPKSNITLWQKSRKGWSVVTNKRFPAFDLIAEKTTQ
jgi:hypothetical protein